MRANPSRNMFIFSSCHERPHAARVHDGVWRAFTQWECARGPAEGAARAPLKRRCVEQDRPGSRALVQGLLPSARRSRNFSFYAKYCSCFQSSEPRSRVPAFPNTVGASCSWSHDTYGVWLISKCTSALWKCNKHTSHHLLVLFAAPKWKKKKVALGRI